MEIRCEMLMKLMAGNGYVYEMRVSGRWKTLQSLLELGVMEHDA